VAQLLASAPGGRPATPALVRDELRAIARGEDAVAAMSMPAGLGAVVRKTVLTTTRTLVSGERPPASSFEQSLRRRSAWIGGGVGALLLLVLVSRSCGGEADPVVVAGVAPAAEKAAVAAIVTAVVPGEAALPAAYVAHAEALLTVTNRKQRRAAAEAIAGASDEEKQAIPGYLRNLAWLEKNQSCDAKKLVLDKIEAEGDLRAIPGLRITAASPRDGCGRGMFRSGDCLECMREDLARVLSRFEVLAEKSQ
jgi:serine/threonine-protein kinase